jgi:hypothetical protein
MSELKHTFEFTLFVSSHKAGDQTTVDAQRQRTDACNE